MMETTQILAIVVAILLISSVFMMWKMKKGAVESMSSIALPPGKDTSVSYTGEATPPVSADDRSAGISNKLAMKKKKAFQVPLVDKNISPVAAASAMTYRHRNIDQTPIIPGRDSPRALLAKKGSNLVRPVPPPVDSVADTVITDMVNESIRRTN